MKIKMNNISFMLMFSMITIALNAQMPVLGQELSKNLTQKNSSAKKSNMILSRQTISWWDSGNGFIRKITVDSISQITRYDKQGNYVETLIQKVWNDDSALLSTFQQSQYKLQKVTGYWEVYDADKKGYYLEMNDSENQVFSVWADDQGKFSTIPTSKPKQ